MQANQSDDKQRYALFIALVMLTMLGYSWYASYVTRAYQPLETEETSEVAEGGVSGPGESSLSPGGGGTQSSAGSNIPTERPTDLESIEFETESFSIAFSPAGGVPVRWTVIDPDYVIHHKSNGDEDEGSTDEVHDLIDEELETKGVARPFEITLKEQDHRYYREFNSMTYEVRDQGEDEQSKWISFMSPKTDSGMYVEKRYQLPKRGFEGKLKITLYNGGENNIVFNDRDMGLGVAMGPGIGLPPTGSSGMMGSRLEYTEAFYQADDSVEGIQKKSKDTETETISGARDPITWAGIQDRYFMFSLIPTSGEFANGGFSAMLSYLEQKVSETGLSTFDDLTHYPRVEVYSKPFNVAAGTSASFEYDFFAGPKDRDVLKASEHDYGQILFYNSFRWFRLLCLGLMIVLGMLHGVLGNWGVAIIALVICLRLVMFPLVQKGMKHQAQMMAQQAKLKPHMDKINEKYKNDPQKKNMAVMNLYREHGVNPFGMFKGCLWMMVQLPIFLALYRILLQSIDLRGASFLWIDDLSGGDKLFPLPFTIPLVGEQYFHILPFLTAGTQLLVSKMSMAANPAMADNPMQKQIMYMMPVMILFVTYSFPSGLFLYWLVSNIWQLVQQQFTNKKYREAAAT